MDQVSHRTRIITRGFAIRLMLSSAEILHGIAHAVLSILNRTIGYGASSGTEFFDSTFSITSAYFISAR